MKRIAYVGVDYPLNHLSIAMMISGKKKFHDIIRLENKDKTVISIKASVATVRGGKRWLILNR
jgi:hypothetical protein